MKILSKCANSDCLEKFRYLNEGKVFLADWLSTGQDDREYADACWRRTEMYWLCGTCSTLFALSKEGGSVIPIQISLIQDANKVLLKEIRIRG